MHNGFIVEIKELRPHTNADKLQLATFFGETVIVGLDTKIGDIGIYFPCDLQLSLEYCDANDLCRKRADGTAGAGYLEREKRNITAIRLRGEKSYGLYAPLHSLAFTGVDLSTFKVGDTIDTVGGISICQKYIPRRPNHAAATGSGNRTRKKKAPIAPLFAEHADTEQLAYNLSAFKPGDEIEITLKMHGTSQRTAYLPVLTRYKRTLWDRICRREGTPVYEYGYVSGTRRTVLEDYEGGYYGSNEFREQHSKVFEGKLQKGEAVYYEVVGFTTSGSPIMGEGKNKKVGEDFVKQYGETTTFSYGCSPTGEKIMYGRDDDGEYAIPIEVPQSDIYVYRMTITNEDGYVVEYTPDFMRYRCEQMGVKCVPVFWKGIITHTTTNYDGTKIYDCWCDGWMGSSGGEETIGEMVKAIAEKFYAGPDPVGKTHTREGVVVRIVNRPKFTAYKHKNFEFKVLEGLVKESATAPDMEEAQEIIEEA